MSISLGGQPKKLEEKKGKNFSPQRPYVFSLELHLLFSKMKVVAEEIPKISSIF